MQAVIVDKRLYRGWSFDDKTQNDYWERSEASREEENMVRIVDKILTKLELLFKLLVLELASVGLQWFLRPAIGFMCPKSVWNLQWLVVNTFLNF
jgi:hypothetical protein